MYTKYVPCRTSEYHKDVTRHTGVKVMNNTNEKSYGQDLNGKSFAVFFLNKR